MSLLPLNASRQRMGWECHYRLTLSTSGIVEGIKRLADDTTFVSTLPSRSTRLSTTRDKSCRLTRLTAYRTRRGHPVFRGYKTGTRPTFEYLLLKGVKDSLDDAKALALFCRQFPVKINIIEYNSGQRPYRLQPGCQQGSICSLVRFLESKISWEYPSQQGKDIDAACGIGQQNS